MLLDSMSLRDRVGQRFITWIDGVALDSPTVQLIKEARPAGVIVYPWNIAAPDEARRFIREIRQLARDVTGGIDLLVTVDQEGGRVAAFRDEGLTRFPSAFRMGSHEDPELMRAVAYVTGRELLDLGVNVNFAPVLDVYGRPDGTIIGDRAFSGDPQLVAELGRAYLDGSRAAGILAVAKHFPGHGPTTVDSHGALPVVTEPLEILMERDLVPFAEAVGAGAQAIMTAHVRYPAIDDALPATLSERHLRYLLRGRLAFDGVVFSDGLAMAAIADNFDIDETLEHLFRAGVDLILVHARYDPRELIDRTVALVESGAIDESFVDEGVRRVLSLKLEMGLIETDVEESR